MLFHLQDLNLMRAYQHSYNINSIIHLGIIYKMAELMNQALWLGEYTNLHIYLHFTKSLHE